MIARLLAALAALLRLQLRPTLILAGTRPGLTLAAPDGVTVDVAARTITGLAVPYGKPGHTSLGLLSFADGSLSWSDPKRVKLLTEHDQRSDVVGYATDLQSQPGVGLMATFYVPEGEAGDRALQSAAAGLRDGLSVGVEPDDRTRQALRQAASRGGVVAASGALRETSLVAVPAFDDARVSSVAASGADGLVVSAWGATDTHPREVTTVECSRCHTVHPLGHACPEPAPIEAAGRGRTGQQNRGQVPADNGDGTQGGGTPPGPEGQTPLAEREPVNPDYQGQEGQVPPNGGAERPAVVRAAAGMALHAVTSEPSVYAFGDESFGTASTSLMRDAAAAAYDGDPDARDRFLRFNRQLAAGNPASVMALAAVAQTTDMPAGQFVVQGYRPDLLVRAIDGGRPLASRLTRIPITDATPFGIPSEGEFDGVGDHTEGTASVADGTLGLGGDVVQPKAVSGSYRLSRELVDSSNPAIDRIAGNAMLRDYRRKSEDKAIAAIVAADGSVTLNINGVLALVGELQDFIDDDGNGAGFVAMSRTFAKAMSIDTDANDRPYLARYGVQNDAPGRVAGATGYEVEGATLVRAPRLATDTAVLVRPEGVLFAESTTQQFRFEQPEGPGIIRLALWGYVGAKVLPAPAGGLPNVSRVSIAAV